MLIHFGSSGTYQVLSHRRYESTLNLRRMCCKAEGLWKKTWSTQALTSRSNALPKWTSKNTRSEYFSRFISKNKRNPKVFFDKISAGNHQLSLATVPINVHSKGLFVNKIREINVKNSPKLAYSANEASNSYSWSTFTPVKFDDMVALANNIKWSRLHAHQGFYQKSLTVAP